MTKQIKIGNVSIGGDAPLALIAGPCVIESLDICLKIAEKLKELSEKHKIPLIFKASYDKANRTSFKSYRGPGIKKGLKILAEVGKEFGLPILTDVHSVEEVKMAGDEVDVIQIPAFLCRQTDLLLAAGKTKKPVNVKKGQFLAPWDVQHIIQKIESTGNKQIILTERGSSFGYNTLIVDMKSLPQMAALGYPVIFDATHSVQKPGGHGSMSGGDRTMVPCLARAAVAAGCNGVFLETHTNPDKALSDRDNSIDVDGIGRLWDVLVKINDAVQG